MKIGLSNLYLTITSFEEFIRNMKNFEGECKIWELVDECKLSLQKRRIKVWKELQHSFSFEYIVHSPFCDLNIASLKSTVRNLSIKIIEKSILNAVTLEAKRFVIHPGFYDVFNLKETKSLNVKSVGRIAEYAEKLNMPLAIENMPKGLSATLCKVSDFKDFFDQLNFTKLGLALDIGHANMVGELESFISEFRDRISHIHIHDNNGNFDSHAAIGEGVINWKNVVRQVKDINFRNYMTIETVKPFESYMKFKSFYSAA